MLTAVPASIEDIPIIYAFCEELIDRYEDPAAVDIPKAKAWTLRKLQSQIADYRVILKDGEKAGYFHFIPGGKGEECELDDLYILPQFRSQGIGTEVIRRCIESSGGAGIFLYVFRENKRAVSLYERLGFTVRETAGTTRLIMTCRRF
ncbi:MAG: GNAT family N-acetyltransferase [Oscillospiraceae bacterium]|nr:GNAT family N-acetyltransferase [Oscillospiraceae bacterium]